jgi:ribonuclease HII
MAYLLGVDEAGYGPNLGPLVVAASAWHVPERIGPEKLYDLLSRVIAAPAAERTSQDHDERLAVGDSKQLYKAGDSLRLLERGVRSALSLLDRCPRRWREIWPRIDPAEAELADFAPWHDDYDEPLPVDGGPGCELPLIALADGLAAACVRIVELRASALFPAEFNRQVERTGNKAEVLSLTSLELVRGMLDRLPDEPAIVTCDKHGGRDYYAGLLQHVFPDELVQIRRETPELSVYVLSHAGRKVEFRFLVGGERMLPTALASMTAKYLRELAMRPFNAFWQQHVPGLKATAGYAVDAKRFLADIREAQQRLKIEQCTFWRSR